jgi:pyruvate kinase
LYEAVNEIALVTKSNGKPLIMATENLETMISRGSPSKSEVISLGHSGDIGADCIMLSEETALSENAKVIVDWLHNFCSGNKGSQAIYSYERSQTIYNPIWKAIGSFSDLSYVLMSKSGYALSQFCAQLPNMDLTLITENRKLGKLAQLYRQNISILVPDDSESAVPSDIVWNTINSHKETLFRNSNKIAAICVSKYVKHSRANSITVYQENDFI